MFIGCQVRRQENKSQVGLPKGQRLRVCIKEVVWSLAWDKVTAGREGARSSVFCAGVPG